MVAIKITGIARDPSGAKYLEAVRRPPFVRELIEGRLAFEWTVAYLVSDDPAKGLGHAAPEALTALLIGRVELCSIGAP